MTMNDTDLNALIAELRECAKNTYSGGGYRYSEVWPEELAAAIAALVQLRDERDTARAAIDGGRRWFAPGWQDSDGNHHVLGTPTVVEEYAENEAVHLREHEATYPGGHPEQIIVVSRLELSWRAVAARVGGDTPEATDEWCHEESCEYRHWRSGSMPTHKRGPRCPPATDTPNNEQES